MRSEVEALGEGRSPHSTEGGVKGPEIGPVARVAGLAKGVEQRFEQAGEMGPFFWFLLQPRQ